MKSDNKYICQENILLKVKVYSLTSSAHWLWKQLNLKRHFEILNLLLSLRLLMIGVHI